MAGETPNDNDEPIATPSKPSTGRLAEPRTPEKAPSEYEEPEEEDEEGDGEEEEPKLKYSRLTASLGAVYRGGDSTSSFVLAGDKIVIGSHNGNVNVISLPSLQSLRSYRVHTASITCISVSPRVVPAPGLRAEALNRAVAASEAHAASSGPAKTPASSLNAPVSSPRTARQNPVPITPSNSIYIATASIDGHVCVASLVDSKDVMLRNFARPVNAVELSPDYKSDRSYLSGGLAGNLILTVGGKRGVSANANTNSAAAAAQGWLGSIGLAPNTGRDTILHSGEGTINTIKWSFTGKFVAWVNEKGIKIMRSNIKLGSEDLEYAWRRIAHIDRPDRGQWEDMAPVWKPRCEWIDDSQLEADDDLPPTSNGTKLSDTPRVDASKALEGARTGRAGNKKRVEKLVVGWGDTIWVLQVRPEGTGSGKHVGEKVIGSASILHQLLFDDCIISGLSLYTPSLLLVLAYRTRDDSDAPIPATLETTPRRGVHHRQTGLQPELRLVNAVTKEEVDVDTLTMSRFESLSAADYHLSTMYVPSASALATAQRGALDALGGIWDASVNASVSATRIFSSGTSIRSFGSGDKLITSPASASVAKGSASGSSGGRARDTFPEAATPGLKIYIQSPYDCVLAVKRDLADHLAWLVEHERYAEAWSLINDHPEVATSPYETSIAEDFPSTPSKHQETLAEFFADRASQTSRSATRAVDNTVAEKEKSRIGEMWLRQLVAAKDWTQAGQVAGKVLGSSSNRWEHWVWNFAQAGRFDEITPYIPTRQLQPPLPSLVYEVVLGHYISRDRPRLKELLDEWDTDLFDVKSVISGIRNKLESGDVQEDAVDDGEQGRDWRILLDSLAKLYLADGRPKEALRCYVRLQNADASMNLISEYHLLADISDDIPGFLALRVSKEQLGSAPLSEVEEACMEGVRLLVDEAYQGTVPPRVVVAQLEGQGRAFRPFLFFYIRALWKGHGTEVAEPEDIISAAKRRKQERMEAEGRVLVEEFGDLAVELFAEYDRPLLMEFLRASRSYAFERAADICERREYYPELVYLLSLTGETKRALDLIINRLGDVSMAISFAKEQDDRDLWDDLLDYSMDKPRFVRGLLEEVGTAIDPITLVRRIPEGLEIPGLRDGVGRMVREYEIQGSISEGVARVLRSEVASGLDALRRGRARGIKFEVVLRDDRPKVEIFVAPVRPPDATKAEIERAAEAEAKDRVPPPSLGEVQPGHCAGCRKVFVEDEADTLIGFACGHVYHLSCLLSRITDENPDLAGVAERLRSQLGADTAMTTDDSRSVGAKVAHAHIIRSVVRGGCVICGMVKDDA